MPHSSTELWSDSPRFREMCGAVLAAGSRVRFHVRGMSMQPNLLDGDKVLVAPVLGAELRKGDIILSQSEEGLRVHRVVTVEAPDGIVTRGDAGQENDFRTQQVIGRVIEIEREGRKTWKARRGRRFLDTTRMLARRAKLAVAVRMKKFSSTAGLLGLALVLGTLLNAAPAAAQADLAVTADTAAPNPVAPGGIITYTVTVRNNGPNTATTPSLTMPTPANTNFVSAAKTGGNFFRS